MRRAAIIACTGLALTATGALAQSDNLSIGGGYGLSNSARVSGHGYHVALNLPIQRALGGPHLRGELLYQAASLFGADCERVDPFYCVGRADDNQIAGAAVYVRIPYLLAGKWRIYFDPIGAGLYHRRTKSRETQGPTALCFVDRQIVSCPSNPPWATFEYSSARTSVGANAGFGLDAVVGRLHLFAELRAHRLFESGESVAGAAPITLGLRF